MYRHRYIVALRLLFRVVLDALILYLLSVAVNTFPNMSDSASSKKFESVDVQLCIICQIPVKSGGKRSDYTSYVVQPSLPSVEKLMNSAELRCSYGEAQFVALKDRISGLSASELLQKSVSYHKTCYKDLTNKTRIERAKVRYSKVGLQVSGSAQDVKIKRKGRPKAGISSQSVLPRRISRCLTFDKDMCVMCQEQKDEKLHNVSTQNMGEQLKDIGQRTGNELLKVRLSKVVSSSDLLTAVAEDMKYHLVCLNQVKRDIEKAEKDFKQHPVFSQIVSDLEILEMVETNINDTTTNRRIILPLFVVSILQLL